MTLGSAIGPPRDKVMRDALESAVDRYLEQRGETVDLLNRTLAALEGAVAELTAIAQQQAAIAESQAAAARALEQRTVQPAPVVNVEVPTPSVHVEPARVDVAAPNVQVDAPNVTVQEAATQRIRKRVIRNPETKLIDEIIEEPA